MNRKLPFISHYLTSKKKALSANLLNSKQEIYAKKKARKSFQQILDLTVKTPLKIILLVFLTYFFLFKVIYPNFNGKYYIEEVVVPQQLLSKGLDGKFVQESILNNINDILSKSQYENDKTGLIIEAENKDDFKMEYEGFNPGNLINIFLFFKKSVETTVI